MTHLTAVIGNIGAGKTTYIEQQTDQIHVPEDIQAWQPYLDDFYLNKNQVTITNLQLIIFLTKQKQYDNVRKNPGKYIFERTQYECLLVFVQALQSHFEDDRLYQLLSDILYWMCIMEPDFDKYVYLKQPVHVLMSRIQKRNRPGEVITYDYIEKLQVYYDKFEKIGLQLKVPGNVKLNKGEMCYTLAQLRDYGIDENLIQQYFEYIERNI